MVVKIFWWIVKTLSKASKRFKTILVVTDLGRDRFNTLRKVLAQKIQESERPTQLSMFDQMLALVMSRAIIVKKCYSY